MKLNKFFISFIGIPSPKYLYEIGRLTTIRLNHSDPCLPSILPLEHAHDFYAGTCSACFVSGWPSQCNNNTLRRNFVEKIQFIKSRYHLPCRVQLPVVRLGAGTWQALTKRTIFHCSNGWLERLIHTSPLSHFPVTAGACLVVLIIIIVVFVFRFYRFFWKWKSTGKLATIMADVIVTRLWLRLKLALTCFL